MAKSRKVHVIGAGLSGMIAALNLAKEGYDVRVLEKYSGIGGSLPHHPSNHGTPMAMKWIWDYIGIDLSDYFLPSSRLDLFIFQNKFSVAENSNFICERGPRKTALDKYLYDQCIEAGVTFEFDRDIKDPLDMPDPTIIATGLHKDMQNVLHRPMLRLPVFASRRKLAPGEQNGHLYSWMDDYTRCYGYAANVNDLQYINMFSYDDLALPDLKKYEYHIRRSTEMVYDKWDYFEVYVPTDSPDAPQLFIGSKILAGTLAGMMCPVAFFGIHGALVSGKIAAAAVSDPEEAMTEFTRMTSNYKAAYRSHRFQRRIPRLRNHITRLVSKHSFLRPLLPIKLGIPGLPDYGPDILDYVGKIRN